MKNKKQNNIEKQNISLHQELKLLKQENLELKNLVKVHQEREKELEILVEEGGVAIIMGDEKGRIINCNKKAVSISGFSKEELKKRKINQILDNQKIPCSFNRKDPEEPINEFNSEQKLLKKNGKKIYVSTTTTLLPNNQYQIIIKDIHARKMAELALIESERRFRMLTENMYDVVWTTDHKLKTVFISSSIQNLTGFQAEFYYKKNLKELVTSISYRLILDTLRKEKEKLKKSLPKKDKYYISIDIKLLHKTKISVWVNMKAVILQNKYGNIIGYQGVFRDIEDKKQILQNLNKHKQRYDFALESTQAGVWELDKNLIKIECDKHLFNLLGYKQKQNILFSDWINTIYLDDRIYVIDILESILENKIHQKTYECRRIHKDKHIVWFKEHAKAITDSEGKVTGIMGNSKDISTEKRIEDKKFKYYAGLQLLIDSSIEFLQLKSFHEINDYIGETLVKMIPDSVIIITTLNEIEKTSKAQNLYGAEFYKLMDEFDEIGWNPFKDTVPVSDKFIEKVKQINLVKYEGGFYHFFEDMSTLKVNNFIRDKFKFKDVYLIGIVAEERIFGNIIILLKENTKIVSPDFLEAFIYIASINILKKHIDTELQRKHLALLKSEKKYKKLIATKDKFFSVISHDLKNPFNTIIGFSGLLMNKYDKLEPSKVKEYSKLIYEAASSSYEMMLNLFKWAKSQRGKLKPVLAYLNINELVDTNLKLFASEAIKKDIKLSYQPIADAEIYSDYNIIDTVLRNLISNAIKFSNRKGTIIISVEKTNTFVQISVADNGIGIQEEKKAKIFKIEQGKTTYGTEQERGSGLGLILSKEFIELLNGKIWFESEEGKGSTFYFTVPLKTNT
ncbi:MAG: PAS domain-containing sensor histidine kinase [Bacteroidales bacterium]|nr:PAS domain-containing sensor histidine kinase [Bacteroidales bacterium]